MVVLTEGLDCQLAPTLKIHIIKNTQIHAYKNILWLFLSPLFVTDLLNNSRLRFIVAVRHGNYLWNLKAMQQFCSQYALLPVDISGCKLGLVAALTSQAFHTASVDLHALPVPRLRGAGLENRPHS